MPIFINGSGGRLGGAGNAKVASGSYVGTGTYGSGNAVTIECGFKPKFLIVKPSMSFARNSEVVLVNDDIYLYDAGGTQSFFNSCVVTDTGVSWRHDTSVELNFNRSDVTYHWFAIG